MIESIKKNNFMNFSCPNKCKGSLHFSENFKNLNCDQCNTSYSIINNIPRIVDIENYSESFGYQWNIHRETQLDSYTSLPISENRLFQATGWNKQTELIGETILEAGSGAGRFTEVLCRTGASLYSFDYSEAVDANARNNSQAKNLFLFQGDIFNIPFKDKSFDHVFCLGVIQHTPDPSAAFISLASKVKKGGFLYIDVYTQSWYHYLHWKYILRPLTKRMNREKLYRLINFIAPKLIPFARFFRKCFGRAGARLIPIVEFSHLGLSKELNEQWSILDTFDMYSPVHDHPQSKASVEAWFKDEGFDNVKVWYGDNGVVGRGRKK